MILITAMSLRVLIAFLLSSTDRDQVTCMYSCNPRSTSILVIRDICVCSCHCSPLLFSPFILSYEYSVLYIMIMSSLVLSSKIIRFDYYSLFRHGVCAGAAYSYDVGYILGVVCNYVPICSYRSRTCLCPVFRV